MELNRLRALRQHIIWQAGASGSSGGNSDEEQKQLQEGQLRVVPSREGHRAAPGSSSRRPSGSATVYLKNDAPTPTHAEKSRTMLQRLNKGVLCTMHQELQYPYGSTVNLGSDEAGRPFTFVSTMAEHTANLLNSSKCSIVVTETQGSGDQLAQARMTVVGDMARVEKTEALKAEFLRVHPEAFYVDFEDFLCMRMTVTAVRYIGGFGEMSWVPPHDFEAAPVDPIAADAAAVASAVEHMNADHAEATLLMVQKLGGLPDALEASVLSFDRYGFDVLAETAEGPRRTRIGFPEPLCGEEEETARAASEGREPMSRSQQLQMAVVERTQFARGAQ